MTGVNHQIVHVLSSPLARPNGIVTYISRICDLQSQQKPLGIEILIDDADPEHLNGLPFHFTQVHILQKYKMSWNQLPEEYSEHPWLQVDTNIINSLAGELSKRAFNVASSGKRLMVYAHCALSARACELADVPYVFVQHESDIQYNTRYSYLSDEWLSVHREQLSSATYIGITVYPGTSNDLSHDTAKELVNLNRDKLVFMPYPIPDTSVKYKLQNLKSYSSAGILVIADGTYRKGLDLYIQWWEANGRPNTTLANWDDVSWAPDSWKRTNWGFKDKYQKYKDMKSADLIFVPSRSEVSCLAAMEGILYNGNVAVFDFPWTRTEFMKQYTHCLLPKNEMNPVLRELIQTDASTRRTNFSYLNRFAEWAIKQPTP